VTIATALKAMGYATGQFGKNHLGDLNEFLPTVHGFDEFFGYLYHLDAMEDPAHPAIRRSCWTRSAAQHGPLLGDRTDDDATVIRAGARSANRRSRTPARSIPKRMETVDDEIRDSPQVHGQGQGDGKPFFLWLNRRACTSSPLSPKVRGACATRKTAGQSTKPAWPRSTSL
jgi:arylsulfatase